MSAALEISEGRALAGIRWATLEDFPHRVPVPQMYEGKCNTDRMMVWLQDRFAEREQYGDRLYAVVQSGRWLIFGFKEKLDAAMFKLLYGDVA